jgi:CHAT domain-containing protein/tetratricopeptide (TPR) repeat protein
MGLLRAGAVPAGGNAPAVSYARAIARTIGTALTLARLSPVGSPPPLAAQQYEAQLPTALVRQDPDSARRAIEGLLARAASRQDRSSANGIIDQADTLANAYAAVWGDSMPARTVAWFRRADPPARSAKAAADSLRRAGSRALGAEGVSPALRLWHAGLRESDRIGDTAGTVALLANIGIGFYTGGQADSATSYLEAAYRTGLSIADYRAAGTAAGTLGSLHKDRGDYRAATARYQEAISLHQRVGDSRGLAADYNNLGLVAAAVGDTARARQSYQQALALNRRYGREAAATANLVNLGTLADIQGDYRAASRAYREGLAIYTSSNDRAHAALVRQNLGRLELRRGNYLAAVAELGQALAEFTVVGSPADVLGAAVDLARAQAAVGKPQAALKTLQAAAGTADRAGVSGSNLAALALARAELFSRLNRLREADRQLAQAERLLKVSDDAAGRANAAEERALLELRQGRPRAARDRLQSAMTARGLAGEARATAATGLLLGYASASAGDTSAARRAYGESGATFARIGDPVGEASALGALAQLTGEQGLPLSADSLYAAALHRLKGRTAPAVAWWLHLGRGQALRAQRDPAGAAEEMRAAIGEVERSAGELDVAANRTAFMGDKWQPYAELAELERERGAVAAGFAVSERLRAQELLELLARARVPLTRDSAVSSEVHELRQRISDLTARLMPADAQAATYRGPPLTRANQDAVREALAAAEDRYAELIDAVRGGEGQAGRLATQPIAAAGEVQRRLGGDQALLEYLVSDSTSMVFVITPDTVVALDLGVGRKALARLIDFARGTIADPGNGLWRSPLRKLYRQLISPVEATGVLAGKRRLIIVPHAELHYLPFAALLGPDPATEFLVQRFTMTYAPSASVWIQLSNRAGPDPANRLLLLAPEHRRTLPGAEAEVRYIAGAYRGAGTTLTGLQASESTFRRLAPEFQVLHLASFGVLNKQNPLFSYVSLRSSQDQDGRLEVHEVFDLPLRARLVVLSACQTALGSGAYGDVPPGDDWVGLVQAFLYAGAARVLATAWPVVDQPTGRLMGEFYRRLHGGTPEDVALAEAQRAVLARTETSAPLYWAGFVLTGGQGGGHP